MKKVVMIIVSVLIMLNFTGCTGLFSSPVSLMSPPRSSGDLVKIEETLAKLKPDYELSYPSDGDYRNAIIIRDLNGDKRNEAIVFYQTSEKQTITVHMNILSKSKDEWTSKYDVALSGTGVERVEFCDVCGDSNEEILVGSKLFNNNEQELNVYKYEKNQVKLLVQERYTSYCTADLGASDKPQILLFKIDNQTNPNTNIIESDESNNFAVTKTISAKLVSFSYENEDTAVALGSVNFDNSIVSFSDIKVGAINDKQNGVFVDAIASDAEMVTEVFYYDETLKTTFYNKRTMITDLTYREALINCRDINGDGKIEIPKAYVCQGYENVEDVSQKAYFTEWYRLENQTITDKVACGFLNVTDNYFISTEDNWVGTITLQRNLNIRERTFYEWDFTKQTYGDMLFKVRVFLKHDFGKNSRGYTKVKSDSEYIYAVKINNDTTSANKVTLDYLKKHIILL